MTTVIHTIRWTDGEVRHACAKERHRSGDAREEIIVLSGNELRIYRNRAPNPDPKARTPWADRNCRRLKQCHNYYSP